MALKAEPLRNWNDNLTHSDRERWICFYPVYINSKKTRAQGRKMPKSKCVENPTFQEINDVAIALGFSTLIENKYYSREKSKEMQFRGRVKIQLKNDDGTPVNPKYPNRDSLFLHIAEMIPKLKSRQSKSDNQSTHGKGKGKGKGKR